MIGRLGQRREDEEMSDHIPKESRRDKLKRARRGRKGRTLPRSGGGAHLTMGRKARIEAARLDDALDELEHYNDQEDYLDDIWAEDEEEEVDEHA